MRSVCSLKTMTKTFLGLAITNPRVQNDVLDLLVNQYGCKMPFGHSTSSEIHGFIKMYAQALGNKILTRRLRIFFESTIDSRTKYLRETIQTYRALRSMLRLNPRPANFQEFVTQKNALKR